MRLRWANHHLERAARPGSHPIRVSSSNTTVGLSAEYFEAHLPEPLGKQDVSRFAVDTTFAAGGLTIWAEYTKQLGRHVRAFPLPFDAVTGTPGSSDNVNYYLAGGEYTYGVFTARFNFSVTDYVAVDTQELRYVSGVAVAINRHFMALIECRRVHLIVRGRRHPIRQKPIRHAAREVLKSEAGIKRLAHVTRLDSSRA